MSKENRTYRIFLSYSHEDEKLVERIAVMLKASDVNQDPHYDKHIRAGAPFTDTIKDYIAHSHIFMPVLTEKSASSHWVHQEIGYASALRIPVLPIAIGSQPEAMVAHQQALKIDSVDKLDTRLPEELAKIDWDLLVASGRRESLTMIEVAEWPEKRSELLASNARRVLGMDQHGKVRQSGGLSFFSIPNIDLGHPNWKVRDGDTRRSDYYHFQIRDERRALEQHVAEAGCDLLIDPIGTIKTVKSIQSRINRLETLLEFLSRHIENEAVRVVSTPRARDANVTIVGDWFVAESRVRRADDGWRNTIFNWHAPTVVQSVRDFDQLFDGLLSAYTNNGTECCRKKAIADIKAEMASLEQQVGARKKSASAGASGRRSTRRDAKDTSGSVSARD